jgi:hypothetical protein
VAEHRRASSAGAGVGPPSSPRAPLPERRLLDPAANDNAPSVAQRIFRAAVFVVIGSALAYLLREVFG